MSVEIVLQPYQFNSTTRIMAVTTSGVSRWRDIFTPPEFNNTFGEWTLLIAEVGKNVILGAALDWAYWCVYCRLCECNKEGINSYYWASAIAEAKGVGDYVTGMTNKANKKLCKKFKNSVSF